MNRRWARRILWVGALLLSGLAWTCAPRGPEELALPPPPPRLEMRLAELLVLGNASAASPEHLLGQPWFVRTDRAANIYVGDRASSSIKVFDPEGTYVRSIGRRGRGPGELVDISCFEITAGGEIVVADGINLRITRFSPDGTVLASQPFDDREILWPRRLREIAPDRFLFLYKLPNVDVDGSKRPDARDLFHLYTGTFSEKLSSFGRFTDVVQDTPIADRLMQLSPGNFWLESDDSILYAPSLYRGLIYRYRESEKGWAPSETLRGYVAESEPFATGGPERYAAEDPTFRIQSRSGTYIGFHHNESRGLYRLNDGRIAHFALIAEDGGRTFGVELFDAAGTLRAYAPLIRITPRPGRPTALPIHVEWKDPQDRFYLRWHENGKAVVKVVRLEESPTSAAGDTPASLGASPESPGEGSTGAEPSWPTAPAERRDV